MEEGRERGRGGGRGKKGDTSGFSVIFARLIMIRTARSFSVFHALIVGRSRAKCVLLLTVTARPVSARYLHLTPNWLLEPVHAV